MISYLICNCQCIICKLIIFSIVTSRHNNYRYLQHINKMFILLAVQLGDTMKNSLNNYCLITGFGN